MNIIWKRSDNSIAITIMAIDIDPQAHAAELKARGDVPADWESVAFNVAVPADRSRRNDWTWDGAQIVVPASAA